MAIFYHASPRRLPVGEHLKTPTGKSCWDCKEGGVVYLVDNPENCARYGMVHAIEVSSAMPYAELRAKQGLPQKKGRYTRGVHVALPENTTILGVAAL